MNARNGLPLAGSETPDATPGAREATSAPSRTRASAPKFANIDLLRAFAALLVVVYHVIEHSHWQAFPVSGPLLAFRIGWTGVDLFFVISGFVITYSALALYRRDAGTFARKYWLHRVSRIVPLYVLTLAAWIAASGHSFFAQPASGWSWQLITHLTFTHSFWIGTHSTIDGVNWTLAVEMQFYLLVALLIPWLDRTPAWRIWLYGIAVSWAWRAAMFVLFGQVDAFTTFMHVTQLPGTLDEFAPGIVLAKLVLDRRPTIKLPALVWPVAAAVSGYVALAIYWRHSVYWDDAGMVVFWHTAFGAFLFSVVAAAVRIPQALATRWLRPFAYLGEISYGIYLWHLFAVQYVIHYLGIGGVRALVGVLAMTVALAALSWHAFEKPILAWARR